MTNKKLTFMAIPVIAVIMIVGAFAPASAGAQVAIPITEVEIDIKPGSDPNSININSMGLVPVAILTTDTFDATTVDPSTLNFRAVADIGLSNSNCVRHGLEDVDGDGDLDLVCKFPQKTTWINCDTTQGAIFGETFGGQSILGFDSINPVGKECNNNNGD